MTNTDLARTARLARLRAARSTQPAYGPVESIKAADLRVGDYVVYAAATATLRGMQAKAVVTHIGAPSAAYTGPAGTRYTFGAEGHGVNIVLAGDRTVVVRRTASS